MTIFLTSLTTTKTNNFNKSYAPTKIKSVKSTRTATRSNLFAFSRTLYPGTFFRIYTAARRNRPVCSKIIFWLVSRSRIRMWSRVRIREDRRRKLCWCRRRSRNRKWFSSLLFSLTKIIIICRSTLPISNKFELINYNYNTYSNQIYYL